MESINRQILQLRKEQGQLESELKLLQAVDSIQQAHKHFEQFKFAYGHLLDSWGKFQECLNAAKDNCPDMLKMANTNGIGDALFKHMLSVQWSTQYNAISAVSALQGFHGLGQDNPFYDFSGKKRIREKDRHNFRKDHAFNGWTEEYHAGNAN